MAARVPASTPRESPSRQVFSSVSAALHQVCTLLRCHRNAGDPARPRPPSSSLAASRRWPTLSAMFSRQSRAGLPFALPPAPPRRPGPQIRPTYADADRARSALTDSAARASSCGLRGGGLPYDDRLCMHTDGYCVSRHDLRMKSVAAGAPFDAEAAAAAAAARPRASAARRGRAPERGIIELVSSRLDLAWRETFACQWRRKFYRSPEVWYEFIM
uniref:Predicted protein n=1 Tax=Hordeum vulgare subsp. vulgare TaxID=112509 RepID=F2CST5_HORVV|nr:predicted protein [Hordeum vulgare subsp. vulgare]